jgi:hypothetical protein
LGLMRLAARGSDDSLCPQLPNPTPRPVDEMTIANVAPFSLSDDELRIEREKLEIWCTPQEFHNTVNALAAKLVRRAKVVVIRVIELWRG